MKKLTTLLVMTVMVGSFLAAGCGKKDSEARVKEDVNATVAAAEKEAAVVKTDADKKAEEAKAAASDLLKK